MKIVLFAVIFVGLTVSAIAAPPKKTQEPADALGSNTIVAKVPANYVALSRLRIPVQNEGQSSFAMLELEAWIGVDKPEDGAKVSSAKSKLTNAIKEAFTSHYAQEFNDPKDGIDLAKKLVMESVNKVCGIGPREVILRDMVLR